MYIYAHCLFNMLFLSIISTAYHLLSGSRAARIAIKLIDFLAIITMNIEWRMMFWRNLANQQWRDRDNTFSTPRPRHKQLLMDPARNLWWIARRELGSGRGNILSIPTPRRLSRLDTYTFTKLCNGLTSLMAIIVVSIHCKIHCKFYGLQAVNYLQLVGRRICINTVFCFMFRHQICEEMASAKEFTDVVECPICSEIYTDSHSSSSSNSEFI